MVAITVILAASVGLLYFSTDTKYLQKPPQAAFEATTVAGVNADTEKLTVPVIKLHKIGGDTLSQEYNEGYIVELNGLKSIFSTQMVKDTK